MKASKTLGGAQRPVSRIFAAGLWILWMFLTVWSTVNVSEGILSLRIFGNRDEMLVYVFAASLQGIASVVWILLPIYFFDPRNRKGFDITLTRTVLAIFLICASAAVMYFEAVHAVLTAVKNSQGGSMRTVEVQDLTRLNGQISAISEQIPLIYKNRLASLGELAKAAALGQDETGIAICGAICKARWNKLADLREKFSDLAANIGKPASTTDDVRTLFLDVVERSKLLGGQVQRLGQFHQYADKAPAPASIASAFDEVKKTIEAKKASYADLLEIDERALAVKETFEIFNRILHFEPVRPIYVLSTVYALMPFLGLIALSVMLARIRSYNAGFTVIGELAEEVEQEQQAKAELEKLAELKKGSFRAWLTARFYDRKPKPDGGGLGLSPAT